MRAGLRVIFQKMMETRSPQGVFRLDSLRDCPDRRKAYGPVSGQLHLGLRGAAPESLTGDRMEALSRLLPSVPISLLERSSQKGQLSPVFLAAGLLLQANDLLELQDTDP